MEQVQSFAPTANPFRTRCAEIETLPASLARWAEERGEHRAFSFVTYADDSAPGVYRSLTWRRLNRRALAVGARVATWARTGDRVGILVPQGLDYVVAFLGCLYAGVVAVPLFSPDLPGHTDRLAAVLGDCDPVGVLTVSSAAGSVRGFLDRHHPDARPTVECVDLVPDEQADGWSPNPTGADDIAYLQYTSGSTRAPAGVVITHRNVVTNARQCMDAFAGPGQPFTTVGWVPLFHDMGLVLLLAAPIVGGAASVLTDPVAFLRRPVRWLHLLSRHPRAVSAAPNVAFELCVTRVPEEERYDLRLDDVVTLINGSEPVRPDTVERFQRAFGPYGLPPEAHRPSYGLAEATVFVSASPLDAAPHEIRLDRDELTTGRVVPVDAEHGGASRLVGCGLPAGQQLRIVDPETCVEVPAGRTGEIWVQGPNVALGYWRRGDQTVETFGGRLRGPDGTLVDGDWLRTGDLGTVHDGHLIITGRHKDLIIVDGRNHYPQDIEQSVQSAHTGLAHLAAFSVERGAAEEVVVVAEHTHQVAGAIDAAAAERAARESVAAAHGLRLAEFVLVEPGAIPRTSSGKVSRNLCRQRYLAGELARATGSAA
jgi:long chain fatty acid CoA FadD26